MSTFQTCLCFAVILFSWGIITKVARVLLPSLKLILDRVSKTLLTISPVVLLFGLSINSSNLFESLMCFSILLSLYVFFFASLSSCYRSFKQLNEAPEKGEGMKVLLSFCLAKDKSQWFREFATRLKKPSEAQKDPADWWKDQRGDRFN